jgi:hypothetical protein
LKGSQENILRNLGYSEEDIEYADDLNIPELFSAIADLTSGLEQNDVTI